MIVSAKDTSENNGSMVHRILRDKEIVTHKIYEKIYPELYVEITEQYDNSINHLYYLSEEAAWQYLQMLHGGFF